MAKVEVVNQVNTKKTLVRVLVYAALTYLFASIAIDRGLIWYVPFFLFAYLALKNLYSLVSRK
jgi:hypothetical protein